MLRLAHLWLVLCFSFVCHLYSNVSWHLISVEKTHVNHLEITRVPGLLGPKVTCHCGTTCHTHGPITRYPRWFFLATWMPPCPETIPLDLSTCAPLQTSRDNILTLLDYMPPLQGCHRSLAKWIHVSPIFSPLGHPETHNMHATCHTLIGSMSCWCHHATVSPSWLRVTPWNHCNHAMCLT